MVRRKDAKQGIRIRRLIQDKPRTRNVYKELKRQQRQSSQARKERLRELHEQDIAELFD